MGNTKLSLFRLIKTEYEVSKYLSILKEINLISIMANTRCSDHSLAIERGRYTQTPVKYRICKYCINMKIQLSLKMNITF